MAYVDDKCFKVSKIPHTKNDIIGKYVERLMTFKEDSESGNQGSSKGSNVTLELLARCGF